MKKSKIFSYAAVFIAFLLLPGTAVSSGAGIKWYSYENGMSAAKKENKKVYINFSADWCKYCKLMDEKTFRNKDVIDFLNGNFISIKIDTTTRADIAKQYNVGPIPANFFVAENGKKIGNRPGYMTPEQFMQLLKMVSEKSW